MQMIAAFRENYCQPAELRVKKIPRPEPADTEILVQVKSCTVNRTDCAVLTAQPAIMRLFLGLFKPRRPVTGTDFAGIVVDHGASVTNFKPGDSVWGFHDEGLSSHAQYLVMDASGSVASMPENVSFERAAAGLEAAHYAHNFISRVMLEAGDRVMVNGATGAIGSALVQFLVAKSVRVTAVANTHNMDRIRALGVEHLYDYLKEDFTTDTGQYKVVFDAVGKSTFGACKHLLQTDGIYISSELGPWLQNPLRALATAWTSGRKVIFPLPSDVPASLHSVGALLSSGEFNPLIDRTYPLEDIADAFTYVASGEKTGNVMLSFPD